MRKETLLYHPYIGLGLAAWGFYSIITQLTQYPDLLLAYALTGFIVVPCVWWMRNFTEQNIDLYVKMAAGNFDSPEEINDQLPKETYYPMIGLIVFALTDYIFKYPFMSCLFAAMIMTYPQNARMYKMIMREVEKEE